MDFTTDREALLAELNLFAGVVENRPSDPLSMFSNVTFRPSENGCELTASGGEIGLRSSIAAETQGEGLLSVPVSLLARWLKEGRAEKVSFHETDQNWIQVRCGGNDTRIPGRVGDPPTLSDPPADPLCTVPSEMFATLLRSGSYAFPAAVDASVATAGAQIEVEGGSVRIVSSDHSRLAYSSASLGDGDGAADGKQAFGLGMKAISELTLLARSGDSGMRFFEGENHLFLEFGHRLLVCAKLADRLPEYEHVIPRDCPIRIRTSREGLLGAVQAALPFSTGDFNRAKLDIGEESIRIDVTSVRGEAISEVEVLEASGTPLTLHLNLVHLRDFAKSFDCEAVALEFNTPDTAFILRPVDEDDSIEHFCVGMPLV
ncbi:MAG: hypothetical protein OXI45_11365 [Acidobacteriota bacterium]|nr:hypothetical protein [Acidobacteriota bacterium]MDE2712513.1 hypothetical protein [Acidobacteriota bacterium]MXW70885.1 hypothetical protein [Acidobacteriota bacterium]MXX85778.1 hypothetical protein [Acidobacteriota bacterium]MYE44288.1 hypothetical protein [Acidobacteriota bacterium]